MKYLVVCDHVKKTIEAADVNIAVSKLDCKKCVGYDLREGRPIRKNVKAYQWDGPDIEARLLPRTKEV